MIGLGTNDPATVDPRQMLESLARLTGAVNRSTQAIPNGTLAPINPGEPLYFKIQTGFAATVADGVTQAIQNAVTNVAMDITVRASDPRVQLVNTTGVLTGIAAGQTAAFDIQFIGDGRPARFDLQFIRSGTSVVLGSIPVVLSTPILVMAISLRICWMAIFIGRRISGTISPTPHRYSPPELIRWCRRMQQPW